MNNIGKNLWVITFPRLVLWLFIILNIAAMLLYPGSTYRDNLTTGYSFTENFLSDLGRTLTFSGEINFASAQLFNMSLILAGAVFTLFYLHVRKVFNKKNLRALAFIGSFFGILGGLSLAGVGLTPADLYLDLHIICANWLFRFMCIASLFYTVVIFRHSTLKNKYAAGYMVFTISILLYILISELGPDPKISHFALVLQVVSQKTILLILMVAIYIQTLGLQKLEK
jgi:hypothetical membrane protein